MKRNRKNEFCGLFGGGITTLILGAVNPTYIKRFYTVPLKAVNYSTII